MRSKESHQKPKSNVDHHMNVLKHFVVISDVERVSRRSRSKRRGIVSECSKKAKKRNDGRNTKHGPTALDIGDVLFDFLQSGHI